MRELFNLTGQVALVIGAGGLGGAQALGFAEYGADVVLADYKHDHLSEIADKIQAMGRKVLTLEVQVADEHSMQNMASKILENFSRIDILANSAGINKPTSDELSPMEGWQEVLDVNLKGTFLGCQIIGQEMIKQKSGKIINISSIKGWYGARRLPEKEDVSSQDKKRPKGPNAYGLSKGAVNTLTRSLAVEMAVHNVNVNAIAPTVMETLLMQDILKREKDAENIKSGIPMGRWGTPEDIVGLSVFLASKASDYITGQIIYLDGGQSCWA